MQYNTKNSNKVTALYARFSRNDSDNESDSIANQRKILQSYAEEKGFTRIRFYADDGISGTTFDRPDFQRLLTDIENGDVETVIVKDLSRFGRLSSMVGYYTDFYFPQNSVRFIAVFDDVDSEKGDNEFAPFKNIFNEWYYSFLKIQNKPNAYKPTFPLKKGTVACNSNSSFNNCYIIF